MYKNYFGSRCSSSCIENPSLRSVFVALLPPVCLLKNDENISHKIANSKTSNNCTFVPDRQSSPEHRPSHLIHISQQPSSRHCPLFKKISRKLRRHLNKPRSPTLFNLLPSSTASRALRTHKSRQNHAWLLSRQGTSGSRFGTAFALLRLWNSIPERYSMPR